MAAARHTNGFYIQAPRLQNVVPTAYAVPMAQELQRIADYLGRLPEDRREALESLRSLIRDAVPEAEECISYGIPAFCLDGRPLVSYGASKKHCAFYPMDPEVLEEHLEELSDFETSKGTIRFQSSAPLPVGVVESILRKRAASIRGSTWIANGLQRGRTSPTRD